MTCIDGSADVGQDTVVGEFCVIRGGVQIGRNCVIGHHVTIHEDTTIGDDVRIDDNAVIGKMPMRAANSAMTTSAELPPCSIANHCLIGTNAIVYRGAVVQAKVLVADFASVRERTSIGEQTIVGRNVTVENKVVIGARCKLESGAYIASLSEVSDDCFVAPMVIFTNDNYVGRSTERFEHYSGARLLRGGRVAAGAILLPGVTIGEDGLVGAGSVVTRDVGNETVVYGCPAKEQRKVDSAQLLEKQR